jgi:hypothetical protein
MPGARIAPEAFRSRSWEQLEVKEGWWGHRVGFSLLTEKTWKTFWKGWKSSFCLFWSIFFRIRIPCTDPDPRELNQCGSMQIRIHNTVHFLVIISYCSYCNFSQICIKIQCFTPKFLSSIPIRHVIPYCEAKKNKINGSDRRKID